MSPAEVRIGMPVVVLIGTSDWVRQGRIVGEAHDVRYGPNCYLWPVAFPSGGVSLLKASEMRPADAVTRLGTLLSECRVEQGESEEADGRA